MRQWLPGIVAIMAALSVLYFWLNRPVPERSSPAGEPVSSNTNRGEHSVRVPNTSETKASETNTPSPTTSTGITAETPDQTKNALAAAPSRSTPSTIPPSPEPEFTALSPATVLENVRSVFREFQSRFGSNPIGTNPEITKALKGGNPRQVDFLNPDDGLRVNAKGELVDPWGTPYFLHQLSAKEMEIHCAGPDRVLWTGDDLVTK